jgi:hypothetical protein
LLVSWCAGGGCGMACSNEDHGRSRRPGAEDRGWSHRSGTRWPVVKRSGGTVCGLHLARGDRSTGFLVEPQNQGRQFVSGLALKPLGQFSSIWLQNRW